MMETIKSAMFSPCGAYRYWLSRIWDESKPACAWIMLNPSTADAEKDDPTIRRVIGFSESWGYGAANVYNLFALRATDPRDMRKHADPIGPENDGWLAQIPQVLTVAAWGAWGNHRHRAFDVRRSMAEGRRPLSCLGLTAAGDPRHPLYMPSASVAVPYPWSNPHPS